MAYKKLDRTTTSSPYVNDKGSNNGIINSYSIIIGDFTTYTNINNSSNISVGDSCTNINITNCNNITVLSGSNITLDNSSDIVCYGDNIKVSNSQNKDVDKSNISYENNIKLINGNYYNENLLEIGGIDVIQTPFTDARLDVGAIDTNYEPHFRQSYLIKKNI